MIALLAQFIFGVLAVYGALTLAYQMGTAAWIWYGRRQVRIADRAKAAKAAAWRDHEIAAQGLMNEVWRKFYESERAA